MILRRMGAVTPPPAVADAPAPAVPAPVPDLPAVPVMPDVGAPSALPGEPVAPSAGPGRGGRGPGRLPLASGSESKGELDCKSLVLFTLTAIHPDPYSP